MNETFDNREEFLSLVRVSLQPFIALVGACVHSGTEKDLEICRHVVCGVLDSAKEMLGTRQQHHGDVH